VIFGYDGQSSDLKIQSQGGLTIFHFWGQNNLSREFNWRW